MSLRTRIFECVRSAGQISRADVAKRLHISPASVTALVAELMDLNLICESRDPARSTARGRPPVDISIRPESGYVVGINLTMSRHTAILVDAAGQPVAETQIDCPPRLRSLSELLTETEQVLSQLLARAGFSRGDIACVGLGMPGMIDFGSGQLVWSPLLTDTEQPLRRMAQDRFGVPVAVDNDANLVTLAELWFGKGRALSDFAVLTVEQGVGMGLVINHRLYRGASNLGMEIGHTKVQLDGALCQCGQRGCLEAYLADYALLREAQTAPLAPGESQLPPAAMIEQLRERAMAGDEAARMIFRRAGRFLALGLSNIFNLFDPPLVIVTGARMQNDFLYSADVWAEMEQLTLNRNSGPNMVETHAWGEMLWAHGAAALALSDVADAMAQGGT